MAVLIGRAALIINPASRRGAAAEARVRRAFAAAGVSPTVRYTECAGDGERVARELAPAHDCLFVLGGDGTVMEAVTGLAAVEADLPVGILPGGTGNQLARAMHIPLSPSRAVRALLRGNADQRMDLGQLNGHRRVGIGAGIGLDAVMTRDARGALKRWLGVLSYFVTATRAAWRPRRFGVRAVVDGEVVEREAAVAMVLNLGRVMNGLIEMAPGSSLLDGQLDLVIVDAKSLRDAISFTFREMVLRARRVDRRWTYRRGRSITLEVAEPGIPAQVDGDLIEANRLAVDVMPMGGRFLLPAGVRLR
ncbi:MAG: YegS/Rv2252/BmrU family lipid kinase [Gemmatimonadaceae bacterium]|nr:YegS/Rv2252/BmrU family lipid kinase [Gemmatimonadaceae bacterium]